MKHQYSIFTVDGKMLGMVQGTSLEYTSNGPGFIMVKDGAQTVALFPSQGFAVALQA